MCSLHESAAWYRHFLLNQSVVAECFHFRKVMMYGMKVIWCFGGGSEFEIDDII